MLSYREEAGALERGKIIRMNDQLATGRSGQPPAEPLPAEPVSDATPEPVSDATPEPVSDATPEPVQDHRPGGGG